MNKKSVVSALVATVLAASCGVALAQPRPQGHDDHGQQGHGGYSQRDGHNDRNHDRNRHEDHRSGQGYDRDSRHADAPPARWNKGDRVPESYRDRQYVIDNWHDHNLRQPPRGYHWISSGSDYFLIGVGTGLVLESVLGH